jgi:hypothetical protein
MRAGSRILVMALMTATLGCANDSMTAESSYSAEGVSIETVVDALPGVKHEFVDMYTDDGVLMFSSIVVSIDARATQSFGDGAYLPKTVRARWREGASPVMSNATRQPEPGAYEGGVVRGDRTIAVAERIPAAVIESIRRDGGGLRLKFRFTEKDLLLGWDVVRSTGKVNTSGDVMEFPEEKIAMAGGDFREAEIFNGKTVRKGWYIDPKTRERIETDE